MRCGGDERERERKMCETVCKKWKWEREGLIVRVFKDEKIGGGRQQGKRSATGSTYLNQWAFIVAPRSIAQAIIALDKALVVGLSQASPALTEA